MHTLPVRNYLGYKNITSIIIRVQIRLYVFILIKKHHSLLSLNKKLKQLKTRRNTHGAVMLIYFTCLCSIPDWLVPYKQAIRTVSILVRNWVFCLYRIVCFNQEARRPSRYTFFLCQFFMSYVNLPFLAPLEPL